MARRNSKKQEETLVDLHDAKVQAQDYVNKNSSLIIGALVAVVVIVGGFFAYQQFVKIPNETNAQVAMRFAQDQFERDSFALALENPGGGNLGFLDIIDQYSGTKAANTARYCAGISYLNLGNYQVAIDYLKDFSPNDALLPITKYGAIGDGYGELGNLDESINFYKKAADAGGNETLVTYYLKKLGLLYEKQGMLAESQKAFEKIKTEYPTSVESQDIQKYITRVASKK
ncbi:MAG: tetratricopeptide (TPR) repeat protein [Saprospiraceae bacterium]|jgi:tetratricopeptide (TPR) repeat protein